MFSTAMASEKDRDDKRYHYDRDDKYRQSTYGPDPYSNSYNMGYSYDGNSYDGNSYDGNSYDGNSYDGNSYDGNSMTATVMTATAARRQQL